MTRLTLHWHLRTIANGCETDLPTEVYCNLASYESDHYDSMLARDALNSDDPVAYLDAVSKDPSRRFQDRFEASELLGQHILERRLLWLTSYPSDINRGIDDSTRQEFISSDLPTNTSGPGHWTERRCPNCQEGEVLYDWDEDKPQCHCGTDIPLPAYPS